MQCLKRGSKVGGPEIGACHRGHGPSGPIASAACADKMKTLKDETSTNGVGGV